MLFAYTNYAVLSVLVHFTVRSSLEHLHLLICLTTTKSKWLVVYPVPVTETQAVGIGSRQ